MNSLSSKHVLQLFLNSSFHTQKYIQMTPWVHNLSDKKSSQLAIKVQLLNPAIPAQSAPGNVTL